MSTTYMIVLLCSQYGPLLITSGDHVTIRRTVPLLYVGFYTPDSNGIAEIAKSGYLESRCPHVLLAAVYVKRKISHLQSYHRFLEAYSVRHGSQPTLDISG